MLSRATIVIAAVLGFVQGAFAQPVTYTGRVEALDGKSCQTYLHVDTETRAAPLALSLQGTGIYSTGNTARIDPALRRLVHKKRVAVVTLDKPGIAADASVDDDAYNRYTQEDLILCAYNALRWARETAPAPLAQDLYFSGHSEGSQVLTRLYRHLVAKEPVLASRVKMLVLSGLPMDDWRQMLDGQLGERHKARFWAGFLGRDDSILRAFGGLTFYYLSNVFAQEPLRKTLESLWSLDVRVPLRIFQGLLDRNTPAESVKAFVEANAARRQRGEPALDLTARYYKAGHSLNSEAIRDIEADLERTL
jgi:hypothetical protein